MANEKKYLLAEADLQEMANYLAGRPYREVAGLIAKLAQLKPVTEATAPAAKPTLAPVPAVPTDTTTN